MSLVGLPLLITAASVAVAFPILLGLFWRRLPGRVLGAILRVLAVLVCQAIAVFAAGVAMNRTFGFYNSWDDLLGKHAGGQALAAKEDSLVPANGSKGKVVTLTISGKVSGATEHVLVWLPPQYSQPAYQKTVFPVIMALPGQPGTPSGIFKIFQLGRFATDAINRHTVKPFVAVLPPLTIAPPRDTECTDVPHGPQADSWLASDVRQDVAKHFRVRPDHWTAMGWSTGGFCAAKMLLRHPAAFSGAVSIGGYFDAEQDSTTGVLFNHSTALRNQNSPLWLMKHAKVSPIRLLIVVSTVDRSSWDGGHYADGQQMVAAAQGVPGVSTILLPSGGHNFDTYGPTVSPALDWLGHNCGL